MLTNYLANDQFFSFFVFTLCAIGVVVAIFGIAFAALQMSRLLEPFREWLRHS